MRNHVEYALGLSARDVAVWNVVYCFSPPSGQGLLQGKFIPRYFYVSQCTSMPEAERKADKVRGREAVTWEQLVATPTVVHKEGQQKVRWRLKDVQHVMWENQVAE